MPRILVDARCIADPHGGGVARMARRWIIAHAAKHPDASYTCFTTGLHPSDTVRRFCDEHRFEYRHIRVPNKLWTIICLLTQLKSVKVEKSLKVRKSRGLFRLLWTVMDSYDYLLLPNLGFIGNVGIPYELLLHDLSFLIEPRWFTWKRRLWHWTLPVGDLIRGARRIDCVSEQTRRDAKTLFGVESTVLNLESGIWNLESVGSHRDSRFSEAEIQDSRFKIQDSFVLFLGPSDPRKNVGMARAAVAAHNQAHPDRPLRLVEVDGNVTDEELQKLYATASALLYPSWYEGFGLPLHEARAFGTPIIASTAGALPDTAPPGTLFCHPAKIHEWVTALEAAVR